MAVLVGIVFIVAELRQNQALMRAQISQARADNLADRYGERINSDHWPRIEALRAAAASDSAWAAALTPEDFQRVRLFVLQEFNDVRNQFYQYEQGNMDQAIWSSSTRGQVRRMLPLIPLFVGPMSSIDPDFVNALDEVAAETGLAPLDVR